jgi:hypothetical protein
MSICNKKMKRSYSTETLLEYSDNNLTEILHNMDNLNINNQNDLFKKIIEKINNLEKKIETLCMVNVKIDELKKNIDKVLIEKDYVIENLSSEIIDLKSQIKEINYNNITSNINSYYG